jgi:predicted HicB family RNase H-like nuclease
MPQPYKGYRQRVTARLPFDVAAKAAEQAALKRWSMSQYVAWCVEAQLNRPPTRNTLPPEEARERVQL